MKVVSLGVGEAFDQQYPNNSHLIMSVNANVLFDCGNSVPPELWKFNDNPNFLDAVYVSHNHWDHVNGLNSVLTRAWQDGREKPVVIMCPRMIEEKMLALTAETPARTILLWAEPEGILEMNGLKFSFGLTNHGVPNLAVRVSDGRHAVCYSGDGEIISSSQSLYEGADVLIQSAYLYDEKKRGHASIKDAIEIAEGQRVKRLMLTHLERNFRKNGLKKISHKIKSNAVCVVVPEPRYEINL